jgi:serine/threonine protein kinase
MPQLASCFHIASLPAEDMKSSSPHSNTLSYLTSHYLIAAEEITTDRNSPLGKNRSGRVFKGFWNDNLVAVKVLSDQTAVDTFKLLSRIQAWQNLRHPHVLKVFGISLVNTAPSFIISQYHSNGDAKELLINNPSVDRAKIMLECALGMKYLHGRGLVHGSLKPTNILITYNGQACIADFGMIELEPSGSAYSHHYFSPEAWRGIISKPSDVFAFAMSSYEIFTSAPPWGALSDEHIYQLVVREDARPDRMSLASQNTHGLTDQIWQIMEEAWQKDANLRLTFGQIVKLWETSEEQDGAGLLRTDLSPGSDSSNTPTIRRYHPYDPGMTPNSFRSFQFDLNSKTRSISSIPPAYPDPSSRRSLSLIMEPRDASYQTFGTTLTRAAPIRNSSLPSLGPPSGGSGGEQPPMMLPFINPDYRMNSNPDRSSHHSYLSDSTTIVNSAQLQRLSSIDPNHAYEGRQMHAPSRIVERDLASNEDSSRSYVRPLETQGDSTICDTLSIASTNHPSGTNTPGQVNAVLLAGALRAEVTEGRKQDVIDNYLQRVMFLCSHSYKEAQKLVTAGIIPTVILLLKARAVDAVGLELALMTLGILACDKITANTIYRTNTTLTLVEILKSSGSDNIMALSAWCISRICRNEEVATSLVKQNLGVLLTRKGFKGNLVSSRSCAWCLGILPYTDFLAQTLASYDIVRASVDHLNRVTTDFNAKVADKCAAMYVIARIARTTQLSTSLIRAGCVPLIIHHLSTSMEPQVLQWSARTVGCLMRPNGSDIAKTLIDAGSARALARLPRVLQPSVVEPLASFAFAIQRFSCAEWGIRSRRALVEAGVVDSLLAALRTSADIVCPLVHVELALAVSFLGEIGGASIREEIVKAGGIDILKQLASASCKSEVPKACDLAITNITGNIWSRNKASAKTAMSHNWKGGSPEYYPPCPLTLLAAE